MNKNKTGERTDSILTESGTLADMLHYKLTKPESNQSPSRLVENL
ncbi:hypothetical protein [Shewanella canadensis]|nr:hypothetical protein [Shewanella canadensis]